MNEYYGDIFGNAMTPKEIVKQANTVDEDKLVVWLEREYDEIAKVNPEWKQYSYDEYDFRYFARQILGELQ